MLFPSGPDHTYVLVMYASSCRLLRPFGAMNGFCGTVGARTSCGVVAEPTNSGTAARSEGFCGIGVGVTPSAKAGADHSVSATMIRPAAIRTSRDASRPSCLDRCLRADI